MYSSDRSSLATKSRLGREPPPTLLNKVNCVGTEDTISECPVSSSQCLAPGAGVICPGNSQDTLIDMPLHGSTLPNYFTTRMHE